MNAAREGQGGLIALSVEECDWLIGWYFAAADAQQIDDDDLAIAARLRVWRRRHVPAGATDDD